MRSPPPPRWSRRKDQRPAEIVAAALRLFAERGYGATKLEDVAKAAGISKGTVYLYFATKEDLFQEVVRRELLPTLEGFEAAVAAHTGPTADLLRMMVRRAQQVMETDVSGIPKLVLTESGNFPELARFYAENVVARGLRLFDTILRRGVERGEFRDIGADRLAPSFIGPILMMLLWRHSIGRHTELRFDHQAVLETHVEILLRGIAAEDGP
jgi:AcrR family transcriptional regulator